MYLARNFCKQTALTQFRRRGFAASELGQHCLHIYPKGGSILRRVSNVFQDVMMQMKHYPFMFEETPDVADSSKHPPDVRYITSTTHRDPPGISKTKAGKKCSLIHILIIYLVFECEQFHIHVKLFKFKDSI